MPLQEFVNPAIDAVERLDLDTLASEKILVNTKDGYAGTTDLVMGRFHVSAIGDFKSKRTKPGKPVEPNQDHALQIAAYHVAAHGCISETDKGFNIYISTTEPGRVEVKEWSSKELVSSWSAFQNCLALWRYQTGYDPRVQ